jgi:SanA protein
MKWLKKFATIFYVIALLALLVFFINSDALSSIIRKFSESDQGVLVQLASYVKTFFKNADTWNYIFLMLTCALSLVIFMGFNLLTNKILNWIGDKYPKLAFVKSQWADYIIQYPLAILFVGVLFIGGTNLFVPYYASKHTANSISEIPKPMPAFVLGTSKMLTSGKGINKYYSQRIDAAMELFRQGKVTYFILSGDGGMDRTDGYDETRDMRNDLLAMGVPDEKIKIDSAGFRTLDSMLRLRALFKLNDIIIVSQAFHTPRAIVLGEFYGLNTIAYNSEGSATSSMMARELGSRPRMIMDLIFFNMQPKVTNQEGQALEYREAFETKSDIHVLIMIGTAVLGFVMIMGYGVYQSHTGEARKKAAKKYSIIGASITVALVIMVGSVYKNLDIKFIDEVVEVVAKTVGVKTEKMEVKQERKEKIIEKIKLEQTASIISLPTKQVVVEKPQPAEFNTAETTTPVVQAVVKEETKPEAKEEAKKEEDLFNTAESDVDVFGNEPKSEGTQSAIKKAGRFFKATVHKGQTVEHDGVITMRLLENIKINGASFPANHIFEAKTILYNNRYVIIADFEETEIKNYDGGKEGAPVQKRQLGKKNEVVLAEGEQVVFGY